MKISVLTLGCKVNQYESGEICEKLQSMGHQTVQTMEEADVYIINTCAVTHEAEKKSRSLVSKCTKQNKDAKVIVMGCGSQNKSDQFKTKTAVSYLLGASKKMLAVLEVEKIAKSMEQGKEVESFVEESESFLQTDVFESNFDKSSHKTRAFLKVQDGCNNFCSYCIIPYLRGRSRSRSLVSIAKEIESLEEVKEIVLVGIDLSDYSAGLDALATNVEKYKIRFRFGSLEARIITRELLEVLSGLDYFCQHFHLSLQAGENETLKSMNRKYTTEEYFEKTQLIREYFPNASITTDIIVGFPTEKKSQFETSMEFAQKVGFSDIHVFPYSVRSGTVASKKYEDLPQAFKTERKNRMSEVKNNLFESYIEKNIGNTLEVLTETLADGYLVGHSREYIKCYVKGDGILPNQIVNVKATKAHLDGMLCEII